ncbi:unnamed protein product [Closterium sp. NIES-64]|nr:unnamed protein product [Closterium sp. NIES-64]
MRGRLRQGARRQRAQCSAYGSGWRAAQASGQRAAGQQQVAARATQGSTGRRAGSVRAARVAGELRAGGEGSVRADPMDAYSYHLRPTMRFQSTQKLLAAMYLPARHEQKYELVDAYSYRDRLTMTKLIVSAANNEFFALDDRWGAVMTGGVR